MESMGMSSRYGCKEVYRFPLLLIPTHLVSALFVHFNFFCSCLCYFREYLIITNHLVSLIIVFLAQFQNG